MTRKMISGKIEEIIYAQLEEGEDLLRALWDICKQKDVKTGVLLDVTGYMRKVRVQREPHEPRPGTGIAGIDFVEIPGGLEVSGHGIIGMGWVPDESIKPSPALTRGGGHTGFGGGGWEGHKTPYIHVHLTVTNASQTVCGHLMEGSYVGTGYFTVAIAKVSGVILRATFDKSGYYHELVPA
ncbi:PCC domain-containing protein [Bradyrhizobium canariense]|uniref:PCC domain-containing protein n=1 Tax=Bradyrhizobium canariense TaxID=255045 RepID=UPI000A19340F|nr:DUF296 domain-containing protein [Bradyrhizobium canariense]OSJ05651.1 hypothetical protein BSZ16_11545 [Bradyrhizobium canariense]